MSVPTIKPILKYPGAKNALAAAAAYYARTREARIRYRRQRYAQVGRLLAARRALRILWGGAR